MVAVTWKELLLEGKQLAVLGCHGSQTQCLTPFSWLKSSSWEDGSLFTGNAKCLHVISVAGSDAPERGTGNKKGIFSFALKSPQTEKMMLWGFLGCDMEI